MGEVKKREKQGFLQKTSKPLEKKQVLKEKKEGLSHDLHGRLLILKLVTLLSL